MAKRHSLSVIDVAKKIGATRCTVYNWYAGRKISNAYQEKVQRLIAKLQAKETP